jgi:hypothetical protein
MLQAWNWRNIFTYSMFWILITFSKF